MSLHHTDTQNKANRMHFSTRDPNDDDVRNPLCSRRNNTKFTRIIQLNPRTKNTLR